MARPTAGGNGTARPSLSADPQHTVAVLFAEICDIGASGLKDPQAQQAEHRDQGEVVSVGGLAGNCQHGLELKAPATRATRPARSPLPVSIPSSSQHRHA